jgi:uncharacterized glyoxalase superfamily protein PhnB
MAKAVGIGGVFLPFEGNEKDVMNWYHKYLGLQLTEYGSGFVDGEQLVLLSFKKNKSNNIYLNLRVDDIETIFETFEKDSIKIISPIQEYEYGKFGQFEDPFGNQIELWEPKEEVYKKMVEEEIKNFKKAN